MTVASALTAPKFAGHETFCLRYGWPKKAVDGTTADRQIFQSDEAMVTLGPCPCCALAAHATAGGRFLWVGGEHGGLLGKLSESLAKADPAILPVSSQYGQDTPVAETARFRFLAEFQGALGEQLYRFVHNPNTKAGWQVPRCRYLLGPAEGVRVLAEMHLPDKTLPVAGAWLGPDGKAKAIFIPEYLIAYVLSDEDTIPDLSRPTLDKVGSRMLSAALAMLRP